MTGRSIALFVAAAVAEIGGAYLMWQAIKEGRGFLFALAGAHRARRVRRHRSNSNPMHNFGRILAAYGGIFVVGSLLWGMAFDGFRPDRYDVSRRGSLPRRRSRDHVRPTLTNRKPPR